MQKRIVRFALLGLIVVAVVGRAQLAGLEVASGNRAQRFVFKGISQTPPPNALTAAQLSATP